jgi:uroporphyrinogen-III synthase
MRVLVVRPQPGADQTAFNLERLGHEALVHPLLETRPVAWDLPGETPDAVILTSAAAVRHAGWKADALKPLPAHAVGGQTALMAKMSGWTNVAIGPGTVQALLDNLATGPQRQLLHLAGAELTAVTVPDTLSLTRVTVYETPLLPLPALPQVDAVLLHSPRTASHFAAEWDRLGGRRDAVAVYAISESALAAAGTGWASTAVAAKATGNALLAMLPKAL